MTERDKRIEEIAEIICGDFANGECLTYGLGFACTHDCESKAKASQLYDAGYRKQTECENVSRYRGVFECSACHWTDEDIGTADPIRFCAGCGAKMKGGADG